MSAFGAYVKEQMDARGWSQTDLANRSKVPDATISRILSQGKRRPNPVNVGKIAKAFDADVGKLMILAGYPMGYPASPEVEEQELLAQIRSLPWLADLTRDIASLSPEHQRVVARVVDALLENGEQSDLEP